MRQHETEPRTGSDCTFATRVVVILLEAKARDAVRTIHPHLDALRESAGFYLSDSVYRYALSLTDEGDT